MHSSTTDQPFYDRLVEHKLIIPVGVPGAFGRGAVFEDVLRRFDAAVSRIANDRRSSIEKSSRRANFWIRFHSSPDRCSASRAPTSSTPSFAAACARGAPGATCSR